PRPFYWKQSVAHEPHWPPRRQHAERLFPRFTDGSAVHRQDLRRPRDPLARACVPVRDPSSPAASPTLTNSGKVQNRHSAAKPQPNGDDVAVWTELECVIFPSSQRRARSASAIARSLKSGCAIKKMLRSHKSGADGREAR